MTDNRARREALGVSQQALADLARVELRAVENLERSSSADPSRHSPSAEKILAILTMLETGKTPIPDGDHARSYWTL